jgi:hypothetical protein
MGAPAGPAGAYRDNAGNGVLIPARLSIDTRRSLFPVMAWPGRLVQHRAAARPGHDVRDESQTLSAPV